MITGLGAALVDLFADVTDAQLHKIGSTKASMSLISPDESEILRKSINIHTRRSGGSLANSIAGIGMLGVESRFFGKVGKDDLATMFRADMQQAGVIFPTTAHNELPTGHSLILITPDAERTMHTVLGASATIEAHELDDNMLKKSDIFFCEGYVWDTPNGQNAFLHAAEITHAGGGKVAFSLSDAQCVGRHHSAFATLITSHIDILLANMDEAHALFGTKDKNGIVTAIRAAQLDAAITNGAKGALIITADTVHEIAASPVPKPLDLTGAGDQFAAGFLAGLVQGKSAATAGHMGAIAAAEVIKHFGPRPQSDVKALLKAHAL